VARMRETAAALAAITGLAEGWSFADAPK